MYNLNGEVNAFMGSNVMAIVERIHEYLRRLPEPLQAEVLDFIEFLLTKSTYEAVPRDEAWWGTFSLAMAMRGMEDERPPDYTISDLKVTFP